MTNHEEQPEEDFDILFNDGEEEPRVFQMVFDIEDFPDIEEDQDQEEDQDRPTTRQDVEEEIQTARGMISWFQQRLNGLNQQDEDYEWDRNKLTEAIDNVSGYIRELTELIQDM